MGRLVLRHHSGIQIFEQYITTHFGSDFSKCQLQANFILTFNLNMQFQFNMHTWILLSDI